MFSNIITPTVVCVVTFLVSVFGIVRIHGYLRNDDRRYRSHEIRNTNSFKSHKSYYFAAASIVYLVILVMGYRSGSDVQRDIYVSDKYDFVYDLAYEKLTIKNKSTGKTLVFSDSDDVDFIVVDDFRLNEGEDASVVDIKKVVVTKHYEFEQFFDYSKRSYDSTDIEIFDEKSLTYDDAWSNAKQTVKEVANNVVSELKDIFD